MIFCACFDFNFYIKFLEMEEKKEISIFDKEVAAATVVRSNQRRKAMIIPFSKGVELAEIVKKKLE